MLISITNVIFTGAKARSSQQRIRTHGSSLDYSRLACCL